MTALATPRVVPDPASSPSSAPSRIYTGADWWASFGYVPLERIHFDPPPGTVTLEFYKKIDGRHEECLVELVNNTLVEKPMGIFESAVAMEIGRLLGNFIKANKLGGRLSGADGMLRMTGNNIRMPDVCWTAPEDIRDPERKEAAPREAPTLAVEIISPSNTAAEIELKLREYFASGCRLAWVVYPETRTLRIHDDPQNVHRFRQLVADDTLDGGNVLPGFSAKVAELFDV